MITPFTFDFGYSWSVAWGHVVPIALFGMLAALAYRARWRRWITVTSALLAAWGFAGLLATHFVFRLNLPEPLPTPRFLGAGSGRAVDIGAGSGRATVGLLLARPQVSVTAVDIYSGYFGIDDNTPDRLLRNAGIAGVAGRTDVQVGDARALPLGSAAYDGVISVAAIDHLPRTGVPAALGEAARVLKPGGEFLLTVVNVDAWAWLTSPHAIAHHRPADPGNWRALLESAGFDVLEHGTRPGRLYFLSRKPY